MATNKKTATKKPAPPPFLMSKMMPPGTPMKMGVAKAGKKKAAKKKSC